MSYTPIPDPLPVSEADGANVTLGVTTDAAVTTDVAGTVNGRMRGIIKILSDVWDSVNSRLKVIGPVTNTELRASAVPVSEADGDNVVLGATTDAAIITDTTGPMNGKLRGMIKILADVWDSGSSKLKVIGPLTNTELRASSICVGSPEWCAQESGAIAGKTAYTYNIFGWRNEWNSTSVLGDVCAYLNGGQDAMNTPATGTTYYVNSTSVQDLTAGTGVDRVRIIYLDGSGNQQVATASLNGTTAVSIGTGFAFIQWMESYHSTTADRIAAGDITISSINGAATEATTMEMIRAGGNRSQSLRYKVPTGYHARVLDYDSESSGTTMDTKLRATVFSDDNSLSNAYHFLDVATLASGATHSSDMKYRELPAGAIVKLSAIPGAKAAGNRLSGSMHILVVAD